jgi:hypothetical protein
VVSRAALSSCGWCGRLRGDVDGSPPFDRTASLLRPRCGWVRRARDVRPGIGRRSERGRVVGLAPGAESFSQHSLLWSALVGYKGARRQLTSGEDNPVGRPTLGPIWLWVDRSHSLCTAR